jgi:hypothetical protein
VLAGFSHDLVSADALAAGRSCPPEAGVCFVRFFHGRLLCLRELDLLWILIHHCGWLFSYRMLVKMNV